MATTDSFEAWIDFLVSDPFIEDPRTCRTAEMAATSAAGVRRDASEARPELELVYVRVARREASQALALPIPEPSETDGLRRRKRRRSPDWLDDETGDWIGH